MSATPTPAPLACALNQLTPCPITWLWPGRLPLGKLSLLQGDPQRGKSLLTLDLAARLSTGRPWPDESRSPGPAPALLINGEDADADTVLPRLQSLGADLGRCFVLPRAALDDGPPLGLPAPTEALEAALNQTRARLVVIDPVLAFLAPGVHLASDQGIRRALRPLARLAEHFECAMLLVLHLNKSGRRQALYRGLGSIGLVAACRSAWLVAADPHDASKGVLAQVKNNLGPAQPSLAFAIRHTDGTNPTVAWLGPTDWLADNLLEPPGKSARAPTPAERAGEFLTAALRDGPRTTIELWAEAAQQGLSERTLRRIAREQLRIISARRWEGGRQLCYWLLPNQVVPPQPGEAAAAVAVEEDPHERYMREMAALYPGPTPLDEL